MNQQLLLGSYGAPLIIVDSADFDGTNDYMTRGAGLTGAEDSATGILVVWLRIDGGDGTVRRFFNGLGSVGGSIRGSRWSLTAGNLFLVSLFDTSNSIVYQMSSSGTYTAGATWRCFLTSWDRSANDLSHLYEADTDVKTETIDDGVATLDYTQADWAVGVGNASTGVEKWNGSIAELYFAPGQYLDFSVEANRRKFISSTGKPVHLGTDGSSPTGTAPLVYQHLDDAETVANFALNAGTGGDFTIIGTLETGSTSPSD